MLIQGVGGHRNLKAGEKIQDGPDHTNFHHGPHNVGQAHIITIDGVDYFMKRPDGPLCGDAFFNGINNQTIQVDGEFVAGILVITSWNKVAGHK